MLSIAIALNVALDLMVLIALTAVLSSTSLLRPHRSAGPSSRRSAGPSAADLYAMTSLADGTTYQQITLADAEPVGASQSG